MPHSTHRGSIVTHPCQRCGMPLHYKRQTKGKHVGQLYRVLFCDSCLKEHRREIQHRTITPQVYDSFRKHWTRICVSCGNEFSVKGMPDSHKHKTCSDECLKLLQGRIMKETFNKHEINPAETNKNWASMLSRAQTAERTKCGPTHWMSKTTTLLSPTGKVFHVVGISHFVRQNPSLFLPEDVEWRPAQRSSVSVPGVASTAPGKLICRALFGLRTVSNGHRKSWKGWKLIGDF